jgi:hypothetical protein
MIRNFEFSTEFCGDQQRKISLPNPWRIKADGKIIRNVPITLYADDTSGNVSKKWNKHISFYFTLSGLPPNLSNQEYNCHFLSTSNRASVLDISPEQIVEEMKSDFILIQIPFFPCRILAYSCLFSS